MSRFDVRLLPNTLRDLREIETYHLAHAAHESERCLDAIEATLDWIADHAHLPPVGRLGLRRASTETFRYHVWYRLFEAERLVQIVAILHHRRGDDALADRSP